jgi:GT2 family glycosyltransferase
MEIGLVATIYIDNDKTYEQAIETLDCIVSKYPLKLYARVTKLDEKYRDILDRFDSVVNNDVNILSRSWNKGIQKAFKDGCEYVIIPNLDIKLYNYTIDNLVGFAKDDDSVMWSGRCTNTGANYPDGDFVVNSYTVYDNFAFFMVNDRLFKEVGKFDEKFIPAYGEDVDMQYRLELAGKKHTCVWMAQFIHFGQTTIKNCKDITESEVKGSTDAYFIKKWGGLPRQQVYLTPFNK